VLQQLTEVFLESALEGEMDAHLGYAKHDAAGDDSGNFRNGLRAKTVISEVGPVEITVPRDRDASFDSQLVKKRQRRLTGVDEMVLSLSAKGLTHGEISAHLAEVYGASVSKTTITAITDGPSPRPLPQRASRPQVRLPRGDEPGPDRQGPRTLDHPLEARSQRLRGRLRRTPVRHPQVEPTKISYTVCLTDPPA
jgi:hypothetical protein